MRMRAIGLGFVLVCALGGLAGCVAGETRAEVGTAAAVAEGCWRDWEGLPAPQQREAFWRLGRALGGADRDLNDRPLPACWQGDAPPPAKSAPR